VSAGNAISSQHAVQSRHILGMRVHHTTYSEAANLISEWSYDAEPCYVCVANVHMVMEAYDSGAFRDVVNGARLVTPDGMPLVWTLRLMGVRSAERVYGPNLTLAVLEQAERRRIPVGFYGGREEVLDKLVKWARGCYPRLQINYAFAPPFGLLTDEQQRSITDDINASGARILFVGLGCPKQEVWMARQRGRISAVTLGVGAAFDFLTGATRQAPVWMQHAGLEWLFRLWTEPRRLWARYLFHNPRFIVLTTIQLIGSLAKRH
jgi:N-acetylglucosaminyldiphosphoundecaprenol N-acetyl-beta-D-mannosaminyltransferase